jgi:hypothetical protein
VLALLVSAYRRTQARRQQARLQVRARRDDIRLDREHADSRRTEAAVAEERARRVATEAELAEERAARKERELESR